MLTNQPMQVSTNVVTHYAIVRNGRDERKLPITYEQYKFIKQEKQDGKPGNNIEIEDKATGKLIYDGEIGAIREFEEIRRQSFSDRGYHCDFGIRHNLHETCACKDEYGVSPSVFRSAAIEVAGKYLYNDDITKEIREETIKQLNPVSQKRIRAPKRTFNSVSSEADMLSVNKAKREEWTEAFIKENDYDGSIMESYIDEASKKMESAINRQWIGNKFITQMARILLRQNNNCPFP